MKMVAAAKMRRAQERMEEARPYEKRLTDLINNLLPDVDRDLLDLLDVREINRVGYVVVTSDRGMAGSFNTNVLKVAQNEIDAIGKEKVDVFCIGKKARDHFKRRDYNIIENHLDFWNDLNYDDAIHSFCHCLPNTWHLMSVMLSCTSNINWFKETFDSSIEEITENLSKFLNESLFPTIPATAYFGSISIIIRLFFSCCFVSSIILFIS